MKRVWLLPARLVIGFQIGAVVSAATACSGGAGDATSSGAGGMTGPGGDASSSGTPDDTQPPHPGGFGLDAPATVTTGTAFLVTWTVSGATRCTGSATLNGSSTNLAGWTDSTSATSPRNVTAASDGTYVLTLKCTNAAGTANSQPATVVASTTSGDGGTNDDCLNPESRLMTSSISYVPGGTGTRPRVDVTSWDNIWGHSTGSDTVVPWPGRSDSAPALLNFGKTQYLAAKFHVPADTSPESYGWITHTEYNFGHDLTASITTKCGDFNPANAHCLTDMTGAVELVPWRTKPGNFRQLTPGQDYYLNIKLTDPSGPSSTCADSATQCVIGTANNFSVP